MTKKEKLRICDIILLIVAILVITSSIQMEISGGSECMGISFTIWTIVHIILAITMILLVSYHLYLHFGWKKWVEKLNKTPKKLTRVLSIAALITFVSGIMSIVAFLVHGQHTSFGGVHGKIGFLMLVIAFAHTVKRAKWLKR